MSIDFADYNRKINSMAEELVKRNPADINETPAKKFQSSILEMVFEIYLNGAKGYDQFQNETRYFPLVARHITSEVLFEALTELLGRQKNGRWAFDPHRGQFLTALKNRLRFRIIDYDKRGYKDSTPIAASEEDVLEYNEAKDAEAALPYDRILNKLSGFGFILEAMNTLRNTADKSSEKQRVYYKGFFTFDTTKALKTNVELAGEAFVHNDEIFPYMTVDLLEYLMTGVFIEITDIIENPLRRGVDLNKRGELLEQFFRLSHPTLNKYSQEYDTIKSAILDAV